MKCPLMVNQTSIGGDHDDVVDYHQNECLGKNCAWWHKRELGGKTYENCAILSIASNIESINMIGLG